MKRSAKLLACVLVLALVLGLGGAALAVLDPADYVGVWEDDTNSVWYEYNEDGTWAAYSLIDLFSDGYYDCKGDNLYTYLPDGTLFYIMTVDSDTMTDTDGNTMYMSSLPEFIDSGLDAAGAVGIWECSDGEHWLALYTGATWILYSADGVQNIGYACIGSNGDIQLYQAADDADALQVLSFNDDGSLSDEDGNTFVLSALPFDHPCVLNSDAGSSAADPDAGSYDGLWKYDDYEVYLDIDEEAGTFELYNDSQSMNGLICPYDDGSLGLLTLYGDEEDETVTLSGDTLIDWEGDTLSRAD